MRDRALEVARRLGLTTWYGNPGSTEIPLLAGLPQDIRYVLALHEGVATAMAAGHALASGRPQLVSLHAGAGLGNAVSSLITAQVSRAPLVVLVGQQDRRHLDFEPFLSARLGGLAGDYPLAVHEPVRAQAVPAALARAHHEAGQGQGPVLLVVPMDDWEQPMEAGELAAAEEVVSSAAADPAQLARLAASLRDSSSPALVAGAGADTEAGWEAMTELAGRLACPVWRDPFSSRAGFPQDHPQFAGVLPAGRSELRRSLREHDLVLVVGAAALRQYHYEPGPLFTPGTVVAVITDRAEEANRSPARLALLGPVAASCRALAQLLPQREGGWRRPGETGPVPDGASPGISAGRLFRALARRLPPEAVLVEECPSARDELERLLPARRPLGFLSAGMGGLGFALGAATGVRLAQPRRPVLAVVGDGSAVYGIQAAWSAAHYRVGALFLVLDNGGYRVMDRLAQGRGPVPWPDFAEVRVDGLARALGCAAERVSEARELDRLLDRVIPGLDAADQPLLINVELAASPGARS